MKIKNEKVKKLRGVVSFAAALAISALSVRALARPASADAVISDLSNYYSAVGDESTAFMVDKGAPGLVSFGNAVNGTNGYGAFCETLTIGHIEGTFHCVSFDNMNSFNSGVKSHNPNYGSVYKCVLVEPPANTNLSITVENGTEYQLEFGFPYEAVKEGDYDYASNQVRFRVDGKLYCIECGAKTSQIKLNYNSDAGADSVTDTLESIAKSSQALIDEAKRCGELPDAWSHANDYLKTVENARKAAMDPENSDKYIVVNLPAGFLNTNEFSNNFKNIYQKDNNGNSVLNTKIIFNIIPDGANDININPVNGQDWDIDSVNLIINFGDYSGNIYGGSLLGGLIVAPNANFVPGGNVNGAVIAKNITSQQEIHQMIVSPDIPVINVPEQPTPPPESSDSDSDSSSDASNDESTSSDESSDVSDEESSSEESSSSTVESGESTSEESTTSSSEEPSEPTPVESTTSSSVESSEPAPEESTTSSSVESSEPAPEESTTSSSVESSEPVPVESTTSSSVESGEPAPEESTTSSSEESSEPAPEESTASSSEEPSEPVPVESTTSSSVESSEPVPVESTTSSNVESSEPVPVESTTSSSEESSEPVPVESTTSSSDEPSEPTSEESTTSSSEEPSEPAPEESTTSSSDEPSEPTPVESTTSSSDEPSEPTPVESTTSSNEESGEPTSEESTSSSENSSGSESSDSDTNSEPVDDNSSDTSSDTSETSDTSDTSNTSGGTSSGGGDTPEKPTTPDKPTEPTTPDEPSDPIKDSTDTTQPPPPDDNLKGDSNDDDNPDKDPEDTGVHDNEVPNVNNKKPDKAPNKTKDKNRVPKPSYLDDTPTPLGHAPSTPVDDLAEPDDEITTIEDMDTPLGGMPSYDTEISTPTPPGGTVDDGIEIDDDEVPLASNPYTGVKDTTKGAAAGAASAAAALALSMAMRKKKQQKEKNEHAEDEEDN